MIPELESLYAKSYERSDLSWWLMDRDMIREYEENVRRVENGYKRLLEALSGKELEMLQRLAEVQDDSTDSERRIFFSQGFCAGLHLGALCSLR